MVKFCGNQEGVRLIFQHNIDGPVYVAGTFNNWNAQATPMHRIADGRWEATLDLAPGEYQFRYVANGRWFTDYAADGIERNSLGEYNSVLVVPQVSEAASPVEQLPAAEKQVSGVKLRRPH